MSYSDVEQPLFTARHQPVSLGRYALRRTLGAGASGTVWAAYDPELEREVAVTLMRTRGSARAELVERARAWQRIDHPNVAKISDVGLFLDPRDPTRRRMGVFLVRELVPGVDLQQWLNTLPEPRDAAVGDRMLALFVAAGRGLAAAHAEGLVHRDFCPASVIVGHDGVARVVDFGSAEARPMSPTDRLEVPRYPAPELQAGTRSDARADQYGLCASLESALSREGAVVIESRLRRVLERGMSERPEERWPGMDELLRAIERSRSGWFGAVASALRGPPRWPGGSGARAHSGRSGQSVAAQADSVHWASTDVPGGTHTPSRRTSRNSSS